MAKKQETPADDVVEAPATENRVAGYSYDASGNPEPGQVLIDPESQETSS